MDYDVVVVGAGPAGCLAAKYAAKNGAKTLIIEEHASIGSPVQCEVVPDGGFHPTRPLRLYQKPYTLSLESILITTMI